MKIVAKMIIRDKNLKILILTRGSTHPIFANHYDLPGGEVEQGEDNETGIIREIKEEIGLDILPSKISLLFDKTVNASLIHILYGYQLDESEPSFTISWEHSSYIWVDEELLLKEKLPENVDPYYKDVIEYLVNEQRT
jgi:8-oxo-dGTP diphosphatase